MTARTLVLVGHGTGDDGHPDPTIADHVAALRETGRYERVAEGYVYGTPTIEETVASCRTDAVVVPLFMTAGYYTQEVIPEKLAEATRSAGSITYTPPVGTHPDVTDVIRRRADAIDAGPRAQTGLALVGHGSERHSGSDTAVRAHASQIREQSIYSSVETFFLDEDPRVETLREAFDEPETIMVPVFMSAGHHVEEDIPQRVGLGADSRPDGDETTLYYTAPVGTSPLLREIILDRAATAETGSKHPSVEAGPPADSTVL